MSKHVMIVITMYMTCILIFYLNFIDYKLQYKGTIRTACPSNVTLTKQEPVRNVGKCTHRLAHNDLCPY